MKVKTDFITNSSSSSFVSVHISSDKLMEILNKYKTAFEALNNNYYSTYLPEFFDDDLSIKKRGLPLTFLKVLQQPRCTAFLFAAVQRSVSKTQIIFLLFLHSSRREQH